MGLTRGYTRHPQLERFRRTSDPVLYIGTYLYYVYLAFRQSLRKHPLASG
jgi:hypothetical protein